MVSYLEMGRSELKERAERAMALLKSCRLCPHECRVDRIKGERGVCQLNDLRLADYGVHFGEEIPLVGSKGSGTIFFSGCNMQCIYCKNYDISQECEGEEITVSELSRMMLSLQKKGCHNISLVTPTHFIPYIMEALYKAVDKGLRLPLVYISGGYESVRTLRLLNQIVDIYMPDIKYSDDQIAVQYSGVKNYFKIVKSAVREMHLQVGDLKIKKGIAERGLLVRHLVLPGKLAGTDKIIRFLTEEISKETYLNIMPHYYPAYRAHRFPPLNRRVSYDEVREAVEIARSYGLTRFS